MFLPLMQGTDLKLRANFFLESVGSGSDYNLLSAEQLLAVGVKIYNFEVSLPHGIEKIGIYKTTVVAEIINQFLFSGFADGPLIEIY